MTGHEGQPGPESAVSAEPVGWHSTELALARMQGELGVRLGERVAKLEKGQDSFATKVDLANAKLWAVISIGGGLISLLLVVLRFISWIWPLPGVTP